MCRATPRRGERSAPLRCGRAADRGRLAWRAAAPFGARTSRASRSNCWRPSGSRSCIPPPAACHSRPGHCKLKAMPTVEAVLTERERASLAVLCDAFHPSLSADPRGGDDPLLFSTSASALGVPRAAERAMALLPALERGELRRLLRLLDSVVGGLVIGKPVGVTKMTTDERERLLRALSVHRIARFRQGFQALKRLSSFLYYSVVDSRGEN